ncbi:MAG TPA: deaminase, partial [Alphaproteobacteria bacterium]|nr:deaminase [Alphaproteobacteria bacterium]
HLLSAERAARGSFYATRVGFVAINPKGQRLARAHNGFPHGVRETLERWGRKEKDFYHLHAECAGIMNAARHGYATQGATAYITHAPCPGCMRALAEAGFAKIVLGEQSLFERQDWREDIERSLALAREHKIEIRIYRDGERSLAAADITRTELDLKKVYDALLPQARGTNEVAGGISPATKPESPQWVEHPVIQALFGCARGGLALLGAGVVVDYRPECRAATALIQAGIRHVVVRQRAGDAQDPRWAEALEMDRAEAILAQDAGVTLDYAETGASLAALLAKAPVYLDATREGLKIEGLRLLRPPARKI